jgi:hypothetical protein
VFHRIRWIVLAAVAVAGASCVVLAAWDVRWLWPLVVIGPALAVGVWDVVQGEHAVRRNHPIVGHFRYLLEDLGPEMHQYFVESNTDGEPFDRDQRSKAYQRAKGALDEKAFGTEIDVYAEGYAWLGHSIRAKTPQPDAGRSLRLTIGGERCRAPYSASILNVSAMSFGSLGAAAVRALNEGARLGGFAQDTGEGGISVHHREAGGDLIWPDRLGLLRLPCRGRRLRSRPLRGAGAGRAGEDGRGQALPGREARPRRHPARAQGDAGDRGGPGRSLRDDLRLATGPPRLHDAHRASRVPRAAARALGREAGRLQALRRQPGRVSRHREGDARDGAAAGLRRDRRR